MYALRLFSSLYITPGSAEYSFDFFEIGSLLFVVCVLCVSTAWNVAYYLPRYIHNRLAFYILGDGQLLF